MNERGRNSARRKYTDLSLALALALARSYSPMAKARPPKKSTTTAAPLDSYSIEGSNTTIRAGDCVLMRSPEPWKPSYVARVEGIVAGAGAGGVQVRVRWYYRPEEAAGGRRSFHGAREVFLSDHRDVQSAEAIEDKCVVHSYREYTKLELVGNEDFFSRFQYKVATGTFYPRKKIRVFCKCELPCNPDKLMIKCEECCDWFHPTCINMTIEEAKNIEHFFCQDCSSELKVHPKRRRRL